MTVRLILTVLFWWVLGVALIISTTLAIDALPWVDVK